MAVIRDVMPAFELFQPATIDDAMRLLGQYGEDAWVMAGGLDTFDWLKDRIKRPESGGRPEPDQRAERHTRTVERRPRDRRDDDADRSGAPSGRPREVQHSVDGSGSGGLAADSQPGHASAATYRRTRAAGITARAGSAIARAATSASPIRRRRSIASTRFWARTAAWP